jgi:site-specific DNA-methyltransferase (adenine-specific)
MMEAIADASVDMILCDLPYGTTDNEWDVPINFDDLWRAYKRIAKPNTAIVLTAQEPFASKLASSNLTWLKYEWIWVKNIATGFLNAKKAPLKDQRPARTRTRSYAPTKCAQSR